MIKIGLSISQVEIGKVYQNFLTVEDELEENTLEYAAAWINNCIMLIGGTNIEIQVFPSSYASPLSTLLLRKYTQIIDVPTEYYGAKLDIAFSPLDGPLEKIGTPTYTLTNRVPRSQIKSSGLYAGVNIGQTGLKILLLDQNGIVPGSRYYSMTWPDPSTKKIKDLLYRINSILERLCKGVNYQMDQLSGIGISIGGIIRDEQIITRSGVSLNMDDKTFSEFKQLKHNLEILTGKVCFVEQDAISKTFAASMLLSLRSCLLVDIGTSTGGSFINEEGHIPEILGQLGRVTIDISREAVERPDGKGRGCLSQYLSTRGLLRLAKKHGLNIEDPLEFEKLLDESFVIRSILDEFSRDAVKCVLTCQNVFKFHSVIVTGGVLSGKIGDYLIERIQEQSKSFPQLAYIKYLRSPDPQYDSCIGVALIAQQRNTA